MTTAEQDTASRRDLRRAQAGDARSLDSLFRRELPRLRRWARARVPPPLWRRADVDDMVQLTMLRALRRYCDFRAREGAEFRHYLRRILLNLTRDELRSARRAPEAVELAEEFDSAQPSSLDLLLGRDAVRRFRVAVATLPPRSRQALLGRLERGLSYEEIARHVKAPGPAAARAIVRRAVERVARQMKAAVTAKRLERKKISRHP